MTAIFKETVSIQVSQPAIRAIKEGHPWVFEKGITKINKECAPGALAVIYDQKRNYTAMGIYDPSSPIKVRVLHRGRQIIIDKEWMTARIMQAVEKRQELIDSGKTTGYRLINGENDRVCGLVLDRYENVLVIKLDTVAWVPHLETLTEIFNELFQPEAIVLRMSRNVQESKYLPKELKDGDVISGFFDGTTVIFKENTILFEADVVKGQKTGFFLDQRDNRAKVSKLAKGKTVLNVFSYNGGFSLYAANGGAKIVVSLDISQPALNAAIRNFELNADNKNIFACKHTVICGDAFSEMEKLHQTGRRFDIVIVDPPSFAKKQTESDSAISAYEKLTALALNLLSKDGVMVNASCSSRVSAEDFFKAITRTAGKAGKRLEIIAKTGHAVDHPIGFTEGEYLKCMFSKLS